MRLDVLIISTLENLAFPEQDHAWEMTSPLFGRNGCLTSIQLVVLIAELEAVIEEQLGKTIVIADDAAMSRSRSPFATVQSLADFLEEKLR